MRPASRIAALICAGCLCLADQSARASDSAPHSEGKVNQPSAEVAATIPADTGKPPYRLKEGDTLEVSVWLEDSLRKELRVLPDGGITFPLVGRVEVAGLTTAEVERKVTAKLQPFLSDPVVNVVITSINGNRVYVIGNVARPGPVVLDVPMTVLQVLSLAGGLGRFADENAIRILRGAAAGVETLHVRYGDLIKGKDLSTNIPLLAGDTLIVP